VNVAIAGTRQGLHAGALRVFAAIWRGRDGWIGCQNRFRATCPAA
jgi:hypothetical protein